MRRTYILVLLATLALLGGLLSNSAVQASGRVALVIGNADYEHAGELANPRNDAEAVASTLKELKFDVIKAIDANHRGVRRAMKAFTDKLPGTKVALFYYAGHGLQVDGRNFLIPTDATLSTKTDLNFEAIPMSWIIEPMEAAKRTNLIFLDACRDNPLSRSLRRGIGARSASSVGSGLAKLKTAVGTMIAYATEPGAIALDGDGKHSPFTAALLRHIKTPGMDIAELMRQVRRDVIAETDGAQVPWDHSSLTSSFAFLPMPKVVPKPKAFVDRKARQEREKAYWQGILLSQNAAAFERYLERYPKGQFANEARHHIQQFVIQTQQKQQNANEARTRAEREQAAIVREREARLALEAAARERDREFDRMKEKIALLTAARKKSEANSTPTPKGDKIASLPTNTPPGASPGTTEGELTKPPPQPTNLSRKDLVSGIQTELKRLGCYTGSIDGKWGRNSIAGILRFNEATASTLARVANTKNFAVLKQVETANICAAIVLREQQENDRRRRAVKRRREEAARAAKAKSRQRTVQKQRSAVKNRPDATSYSMQVWGGGSIRHNQERTRGTQYGTLVCVGGNNNQGIPRRCRWR